MKNRWAAIGGGLALLAVAFGAFGAHGLEGHVTATRLEVYKTGASYQMVHALGLLLISQRFRDGHASRWITASCYLLTAGVILFSGSLYALVLTDERRWGIITPLGGLSFMAGWACFVVAMLIDRNPNNP